MARIADRCNRGRTRNTFWKKLEWYVKPRKCKVCGHTRFYWDKERNKRRAGCGCGGYWFPHRPGSRFCYLNPKHIINELIYRQRVNADELLDAKLEMDGEPVETCPF